jgi:hypothetical protein
MTTIVIEDEVKILTVVQDRRHILLSSLWPVFQG